MRFWTRTVPTLLAEVKALPGSAEVLLRMMLFRMTTFCAAHKLTPEPVRLFSMVLPVTAEPRTP
jgi:hypothetical protein